MVLKANLISYTWNQISKQYLSYFSYHMHLISLSELQLLATVSLSELQLQIANFLWLDEGFISESFNRYSQNHYAMKKQLLDYSKTKFGPLALVLTKPFWRVNELWQIFQRWDEKRFSGELDGTGVVNFWKGFTFFRDSNYVFRFTIFFGLLFHI